MEIKHYDREIPLIDLVPGDANKPHHVCLVCAYSTREKQTIEERIREKFKEISIEPLNQNGKINNIILCIHAQCHIL